MSTFAPTIVVHQFQSRYKPDPTDASKMRAVDWVIYSPIGSNERTHSRIHDLERVIVSDDNTNPAIAMAHARWAFIQPLYEAWKSGQEMPETGTPLAAWNLLTPEQAEVFRARGIKTVEQIAMMSGGHAEKVPLPHMTDIVKQAQNFIASADQVRAAADLQEKDRQIKALQVENEERDEQIKALLQRVDALAQMVADSKDAEPAKRKPGRPKKEQEPAEQAAA